jgi:hypothetical protein
MIYTGNFIIDYVNPLFKGNFNIFDGNVNLGQKNILIDTAVNFMENSLNSKQNNLVVYITYTKKDAILLKEKLQNKLKDLSIKFSKELNQNQNKDNNENNNKDKDNQNIDNKTDTDIDLDNSLDIKNQVIVTKELINSQNSKFLIFSLGENSTNSEKYYLPKIAFNYINNIIKQKHLIFKNENKLNILFCQDDLSGFVLSERRFYEATKLYQVKNKIK